MKSADLVGEAGWLSDELVDLRRTLHHQPELGLSLPETQSAVLRALRTLPLELTKGTTSTSVVGVLRGGKEHRSNRDSASDVTPARPIVLLRADMDALPVHEELALDYRSQIDGRMHACGHDLHTAMLVGAAKLLSAHKDSLPGDVVFMFQPGEEGYDGAAHMISEGVLAAAGRQADVAYALHVFSNLIPRGQIATRPGTIMAACDALIVTVRGVGGHGALPHLTRDPVPAACEMVLELQRQVNRAISAFEAAVLTVGMLHAGNQRNIIAATTTFEATVRTFDLRTRQAVLEVCERVCQGIALAHDVEVTVDFRSEYPVTVNDPTETRLATAVVADLFGDACLESLGNPLVTSEDFSRVIASVPGAMLLLGAHIDDRDPDTAPSNHAPTAAFDESVIARGAAILAGLAFRRLGG
jgi:amidohydrolase